MRNKYRFENGFIIIKKWFLYKEESILENEMDTIL